MKVEQVLHMNTGNNDKSYAKNSTIQSEILLMTRSVRQSAVMDAYKSTSFPKTITMGDLGCSSGPNTMLVASDAIEALALLHKELKQEQLPEIHIILNDLPKNDFNVLINLLEDFQNSHRCFISVVPGSFYSRLFPSHSLHYIHSSSSLHWLSQVPLELQKEENVKINKGKLYISKTSPPFVFDAYSKQFQRDFSLFLKCRGEELVPGGCMVLTLQSITRNSDPSDVENCYMWEIMAQALMDLVSQGVVDKEMIDSFNAPFYVPSPEEIKHALETEGSFSIKSIESFDVTSVGPEGAVKPHEIAHKTIRACTESMLASHFGEEIIDELYVRYRYWLQDHFSKNMHGTTSTVVFVKRN